jgi:hypothetical protein
VNQKNVLARVCFDSAADPEQATRYELFLLALVKKIFFNFSQPRDFLYRSMHRKFCAQNKRPSKPLVNPHTDTDTPGRNSTLSSTLTLESKWIFSRFDAWWPLRCR